MIKCIVGVVFILGLSSLNYTKNYFENGIIKSEGWVENDKKIKYWYYYNSNGSLKAKGHYDNDRKNQYWFYYDDKGNIAKEGLYENDKKSGWWKNYKNDTIEEVKYKDSKKTGLSVYKVNDEPVKAEYYKNGLRTHQWFTISDFKKEYFKIDK